MTRHLTLPYHSHGQMTAGLRFIHVSLKILFVMLGLSIRRELAINRGPVPCGAQFAIKS